jgi:hypothetical protein
MKAQKSLVLKFKTQQELFAFLMRKHHYTLMEWLGRVKSFLKVSASKLSAGINSIL